MRVKIPEFATQKELFAYLIANKESIIQDKKSLVIKSDVMSAGPITDAEDGIQVKAMGNDTFAVKEGSLIVDVIANLSNYCDSYMDVMLPDSWAKSIKEKGANIPFLHDHRWDVMAKIAKTLAVYAMDVPTKDLGIKSDVKSAQALIFKGELREDINEKMYNFYRNGMVNQHSIGLQYVQIELAINDPDEKDAYKVWNKYFSGIINKEYVEKKGYFWAVKEAKIYENSAVLYGANEMTPTLSTEEKSLEASEPHYVKCGGCNLEFNYLSTSEAGMGYVECPSCKSPVTQTGTPKSEEPTNTIGWKHLQNYLE